MPRYRAKPREVEALQWMGQPWDIFPEAFQQWTSESGSAITCYTLNGPMRVEKGDWLILGEVEVYPCKSDEFEKRYERIDDMQQFGTSGEEHG